VAKGISLQIVMRQLRGAEYQEDGAKFRGMIIKSWLKSFEHSPWAGISSPTDYYTVTGRAVAAILARPTVAVHVAMLPEIGPDELGAFVVAETAPTYPIVHYAYTTNAWRQHGIAGKLLAHCVGGSPTFAYTFKTNKTRHLLRHHRTRFERRYAVEPRSRWQYFDTPRRPHVGQHAPQVERIG